MSGSSIVHQGAHRAYPCKHRDPLRFDTKSATNFRETHKTQKRTSRANEPPTSRTHLLHHRLGKVVVTISTGHREGGSAPMNTPDPGPRRPQPRTPGQVMTCDGAARLWPFQPGVGCPSGAPPRADIEPGSRAAPSRLAAPRLQSSITSSSGRQRNRRALSRRPCPCRSE